MTAANATFVPVDGFCGGESCELQCNDGFVDCSDTDDGCETSLASLDALHETVGDNSSGLGNGGGCGGGYYGSGGGTTVGQIGTCSIVCEYGWLDCDGNKADGCETQGTSCFPSPETGTDGGPNPPTVTLESTPLGLAACGGSVFVLDGQTVRKIDIGSFDTAAVAMSPSTPARGLACDGSYLYWATAANADATPNGTLVRMNIMTYVIEALATGLDPGVGVGVRPTTAYFIARTGVSDSGTTLAALSLVDGGITPWMPAVETPAYKAFTVVAADDWSLASGVVYRRPLDGGATSAVDAGAASAVSVGSDGTPYVVLHSVLVTADAGAADAGVSDAATDAGMDAMPTSIDQLVQLTDDAGTTALVTLPTDMPTIVTTGDSTVLASDYAVYSVGAGGVVSVVATSTTPIAYVATDGGFVFWATQPTVTMAGVVQRGTL